MSEVEDTAGIVTKLEATKSSMDRMCKKLDDYMHKINLLAEDEEHISGCAEALISLSVEYGRLYDRAYTNPLSKYRPLATLSQKSLDVLLLKE